MFTSSAEQIASIVTREKFKFSEQHYVSVMIKHSAIFVVSVRSETSIFIVRLKSFPKCKHNTI